MDRQDAITETLRIADSVVNDPSLILAAEQARKAAGVQHGGPMLNLRRHLALAFANGYMAGWRARERVRGDIPPPPAEAEL